MISSCAVNIKRKLTQFAISWFWQICNLAFPIPRPPSFKLPCYCCWPKAFWTRSSTSTSTSSTWTKGEKIYLFMISKSPWLASAGEIVHWKYIIGEERAAVNVKRREMAGSKKGDRKGDCSYKAPPHHNLATLIIIWSFILLQVSSYIFVSCERVVKKYSAQCTSSTAWCHWTPMGSNVKICSLWLTLFSDVLSCYIFAIWQSRFLDSLDFSLISV